MILPCTLRLVESEQSQGISGSTTESAARSGTRRSGCLTAAARTASSALTGPRKGRPPAGYLAERTAEQALDALLTDARRGHWPGRVTGGEKSSPRTTER